MIRVKYVCILWSALMECKVIAFFMGPQGTTKVAWITCENVAICQLPFLPNGQIRPKLPGLRRPPYSFRHMIGVCDVKFKRYQSDFFDPNRINIVNFMKVVELLYKIETISREMFIWIFNREYWSKNIHTCLNQKIYIIWGMFRIYLPKK